jgi:Leucine-rich repeat (LRR) protein
VPEYVINFEYVNKVNNCFYFIYDEIELRNSVLNIRFYYLKNNYLNEYEKELSLFESKSGNRSPSSFAHSATPEPTVAKNIRVANSPKTEELVKSQIEIDLRRFDENFNNITHLNLHNVGLSNPDIEPLNNLRSVSHLYMSFNNLKYLKDCQIFVSLNLFLLSFEYIKIFYFK